MMNAHKVAINKNFRPQIFPSRLLLLLLLLLFGWCCLPQPLLLLLHGRCDIMPERKITRFESLNDLIRPKNGAWLATTARHGMARRASLATPPPAARLPYPPLLLLLQQFVDFCLFDICFSVVCGSHNCFFIQSPFFLFLLPLSLCVCVCDFVLRYKIDDGHPSKICVLPSICVCVFG